METGHIKLTSLKQDGCDLNWELETDINKVVFILSQTSAMRERLTQIITVLAFSVSGLGRIAAECEVSGVTKILLKAHPAVLQVIPVLSKEKISRD